MLINYKCFFLLQLDEVLLGKLKTYSKNVIIIYYDPKVLPDVK